MEKIELRFIDSKMESADDGTLKVSGYVNKTNKWSEELGTRAKFVERIVPGTFDKALRHGNEVHFYAEHDPAKILASTRNGSLTLREDETGLYMEATIAPTSWGKDYHTLIKEGIINNMSFGMKVLKDSWQKRNDGINERTISDLYLAEVSAVRNPAYAQSTIAARSIEVIEDVVPPEDEKIEDRKESNQMELELRDKLAEVLDKILAHLETQKTEAPEQPKIEEQPKAEEKPSVVEETPPVVEEKPKEAAPKVEEKAPEVPVEQPKEEPKPETVVEKVVENVKEDVEKVVEKVKEIVEENPNLSEFYKKLLDF